MVSEKSWSLIELETIKMRGANFVIAGGSAGCHYNNL